MTTLFMDGFDHYGTGPSSLLNMLDGTWGQAQDGSSSGVGVPPWGTRTGSGALHSSNGGLYRYILPATQSNLFLSMGFSIAVIPSTNFQTQVINFRDATNADIIRLHVQSTGTLVLTDGSNHVLGSTQGPVIVAQNWHFLEMNFNQGTGTFTLRIDDSNGTGTPIMNVTGITAPLPIAQLAVNITFSGDATHDSWIDDLFIRNGSGTLNNGFLGDRRVATLFTSADTAVSGWTPSYYKEFGAGILSLATKVPNISTPVNPDCGLSTPASSSLDIGASDFTLETMVRWDSLPSAANYSTIFSRWNTATPSLSYRLILGGSAFNNGCLQFDTTTDGTASTLATPIVFPWVPQLNRWYHLALVRASGQLLLFVDGQQFGLPITDSRTYFSGGTEPLTIGVQATGTSGSNTGTGITGRLDETRFTNGIARYTGPFTPPTVAFPRGPSLDPDWTSVVLLMGYDSTPVQDESSFARTISNSLLAPFGGPPTVFFPADGPGVGAFSTNNKAVPDDNTFISASFVPATNTLTMTTQPTTGNTITLGTKDGTTPAVYTFKSSVTTAFDVLIDTTAQNTLINFFNAVNAGAGAGTKYGTGTLANFDVNAVQLPVGQIEVVANISGTGGNSIPSTRTGTAASWASATLLGGSNIPGPSEFKFQRPPNNTTIISALQTNARALKTDSGLATIQTTLIGPLGGTTAGTAHALTTSPSYYLDIVELDPDTGAGLTPTTIVNGKIEINRTV
jgi:Concanavalin A-like lectin/glucanases superfamily